MSAGAQTKIFGIRVGVDPKWIVVGLIAAAALLFWMNSKSNDQTSGPIASAARTTAVPPSDGAVPLRNRARLARRTVQPANERGVLRLKPVDATDGRIDPTLRLDLLSRLQSVQPMTPGRSLFEVGPSQQDVAAQKLAANAPKIPIRTPAVPQPAPPPVPVRPQVNIPLKFYGFVKPESKGETNRGLFLENDNILVAQEGDVLDRKYLVVELTPNTARLEDVQLKQGQTLTVVPEAVQQQQ